MTDDLVKRLRALADETTLKCWEPRHGAWLSGLRDAASALESLSAENAALKANIEQRDEFIKELSDALLSIRPLGGSELFVRRFGKYFADPKYCKAAIQAQSSKLNEAMKEGVRQRKANATLLQQRNEAFERAAAVARDRAAKLRAKAKAQKTATSQHYFAQAIEARNIEGTILALRKSEDF